MTIDEQLQKIEKLVDKQEYCWFRLLRAKIGATKSYGWQAYVESIQGMQFINHASSLDLLLPKVIQYLENHIEHTKTKRD